MIVAVSSYSGSVGRTTLSAHLLRPRMNDAPVIAGESTNQTVANLGLTAVKTQARQAMGEGREDESCELFSLHWLQQRGKQLQANLDQVFHRVCGV